MNWRLLKTNFKVILLFGAVVLVLSLFCMFYYIPKSNLYVKLKAELHALDNLLQEKTKEHDTISFYENQNRLLIKEVKSLNLQYDFEQKKVFWVEKLFSLSRISNVKIKNIQYQGEDSIYTRVQTVQLRVSVEGQYPNIKQFLYNIENDSQLMEIKELQLLNAGNLANGSVLLAGNFNISIYSFLPEGD